MYMKEDSVRMLLSIHDGLVLLLMDVERRQRAANCCDATELGCGGE